MRFEEINHLAAGFSHMPPNDSISKEEEDWLFKEMKRYGAFRGIPGSVARKREKWDIIRRQALVWEFEIAVKRQALQP